MSKPRFLFASANPSADQPDLEKSLQKEYDFIDDLLSETNTQARPLLEFSGRTGARLDRILSYVDHPDLRNEIFYFHFAGHGLDGNLYFQGEKGESQQARLEGLGPILNRFPNLKLVFLNCCTAEQLAKEIASEDRIVIASPHKIPSYQAAHFAKCFYELLLEENPIRFAFSTALNKVDTIQDWDEKRAVFDLEEEEEAPLTNFKDLFKIYPSERAEGAGERLRDLLELYQLDREGEGVLRESPKVQSKLFRPVLDLNYRQQMLEYNGIRFQEGKNIMAFLVHGLPGSATPLVHHRFLMNVVKGQTLRMVEDFKKRNEASTIASLWAGFGKTLGYYGEPKPGLVAKEALRVLGESRQDIVVTVFNALHNGAPQLKALLEEFWFQLLKEMGYDIFHLERKLWLFLYVEDEQHHEKCAPLQGMGGDDFADYFTAMSPLDLFKQNELLEVLDNHRDTLLKPGQHSKTEKISQMIMGKSQGVPLRVLEELCAFMKDDLALLTQQLKAI